MSEPRQMASDQRTCGVNIYTGKRANRKQHGERNSMAMDRTSCIRAADDWQPLQRTGSVHRMLMCSLEKARNVVEDAGFVLRVQRFPDISALCLEALLEAVCITLLLISTNRLLGQWFVRCG
jgi:hypothetical protein